MSCARVLIVEDEDFIRLILAEILIDEGFQVSEASTGAEAMQLIDGPDGFHAVVTDINMPGEWNGIAVGRHARRRHPSIPVIYCTGRPDALHAGLLGPRDILIPKPYVPSQVIGVLCQLLARPRGGLERPSAWSAAAALMQPGSGGGLILPRLGQEDGAA